MTAVVRFDQHSDCSKKECFNFQSTGSVSAYARAQPFHAYCCNNWINQVMYF